MGTEIKRLFILLNTYLIYNYYFSTVLNRKEHKHNSYA